MTTIKIDNPIIGLIVFFIFVTGFVTIIFDIAECIKQRVINKHKVNIKP